MLWTIFKPTGTKINHAINPCAIILLYRTFITILHELAVAYGYIPA